jgi:hypothetical protein
MSELCNVEVKGWINSMCFSHDRRFLFCGVGREHRLGRWYTDESGDLGYLRHWRVGVGALTVLFLARDGIAIVGLPPIDLQQHNSA